MFNNVIKIALIAVIAFAAFGCSQNVMVQEESRLDKNWGRSFESARYNQILNPEAGKSAEPATGMQGAAAERIMENYIKGDTCNQDSSPEFGVVTIKK